MVKHINLIVNQKDKVKCFKCKAMQLRNAILDWTANAKRLRLHPPITPYDKRTNAMKSSYNLDRWIKPKQQTNIDNTNRNTNSLPPTQPDPTPPPSVQPTITDLFDAISKEIAEKVS